LKIDPVVLNSMPGSFAKACKCVPIKCVDNCYYIAMSDPLNSECVKEIKSYLGAADLKVFLSGDREISDTIRSYYGA
ncbi:MAG TPA: hypothetical protein PLU24_05635, partial [Candidatus Omnitrophota bacterium]|nr:hypothetical protein [Candidatus Omnitrophota bacterium]